MTETKHVRVELPYQPRAPQHAAHLARLAARFLVLVWHRRAGKTVFAVMELVLAAIACTRERGRYGYIAPFLGQSKEIAWAYLLAFTKDIPGCAVSIAELSVTLPNGARIRLYGADNPDAIRGAYFDGVVLDEVADMKPSMWGEIVRPMLADREGWALFIGTPHGINLFSELYYAALGGRPGWAASMLRASESGILSDEELAAAREDIDSDSAYAREFECDFSAASDDQLLSLDEVLAAQKRTVGEHEFSSEAKIMGIDPARKGGDRAAFGFRQGIIAFQPKVMRGLEMPDLEGQAVMAIEKWQPHAVFVDSGGMGAGVVDHLRRSVACPVIGVDFGGKALEKRFFNRRSEMWWHLAAWVKSGGCLPAGQEIAIDLTMPEYGYGSGDGGFRLESKDHMRERARRSPDVGDALALTFAQPVPAPHMRAARSNTAARLAATTYNPLERHAHG